MEPSITLESPVPLLYLDLNNVKEGASAAVGAYLK